MPKLTKADQLNYTAASAAASKIIRFCEDAGFIAPECLDLHQAKIAHICGAMNDIVDALMIRQPAAPAPAPDPALVYVLPSVDDSTNCAYAYRAVNNGGDITRTGVSVNLPGDPAKFGLNRIAMQIEGHDTVAALAELEQGLARALAEVIQLRKVEEAIASTAS